MSSFGALWRIRTHKHIRTRRSMPTSTGPARAAWPRLQETESLKFEEQRLKNRRRHVIHSTGPLAAIHT